MKKVFQIIILSVFIAAVIVPGDVSAATGTKPEKVKWVKSKTGIKSLMSLSSDRGDMIKEYNDETKNYENIKAAIDQGELKEGMEGAKIARQYGLPVILLEDPDSDDTRWVYKPGDVSFLDAGEKAYLTFDANQTLISWKLVEKKKKDE
jgi:hypothetical protein